MDGGPCEGASLSTSTGGAGLARERSEACDPILCDPGGGAAVVVDLSLWTIVLLAGAGFAAGAINAAAGGGSLVTFPALVVVGYPPLIANITNNVAVSPGYITGAWGYRRELRGQRRRIAALAVVSAFGSLVGVGLILVSSQGAFEGIVPFLVLAACALLAVQPVIGRRTGERTDQRGRPGV